MDYRIVLKEENEAVRERFELAADRIREIASAKNAAVSGELGEYFKKTAAFCTRSFGRSACLFLSRISRR